MIMGAMSLRAVLARTVEFELDIGGQFDTLVKSKRIVIVEALLEPLAEIHMELLQILFPNRRNKWEIFAFRKIDRPIFVCREVGLVISKGDKVRSSRRKFQSNAQTGNPFGLTVRQAGEAFATPNNLQSSIRKSDFTRVKAFH